jgi:hypothetical protein
MRNPFFKDSNREQDLVEQLTVETIKSMGRDMVYIPRTLVNKDDLFGEDSISKFDDGYPVEMYVQSVDGFEGEGDILSTFGIQIKDKINLVVSKRRFEESVGVYADITRPKEGDLIFFPLSNTLFEINFVEHEYPFYQLGKLYTYLLSCEVFTYSQEDIDTGFSNIDKIETDRQQFAMNLSLGTRVSDVSYTNYFEGETVYQVSGVTGATASLGNATATATVTDWDSNVPLLTVSNLSGTLSTSSGETVIGAVSGAEYELSSTTTTTIIIPQDPQDTSPSGDNEEIELIRDQDDIFDFTETDPFSEGNY